LQSTDGGATLRGGGIAVLELTNHTDHCRLTLAAGRGNALSLELLTQLLLAIERAARLAPALLLAAQGRSFCTGLDLRLASRLDRAGMDELMAAFDAALSALFRFPGPTVAAIGGNALAGGALLALACDTRLVAEGAGRLGIHGARLGIAYPDIAIEIVRARLSRAQVEATLYGGEIFTAEAAVERGFAQAVVPEDELIPACLDCIRAPGAPAALADAKARLLRPAWARLWPRDRDAADRWLDIWFSGPTQRQISASLAPRGDASESAGPI
jgi:enoyl-CoA hydratase